MGIVICKFDIQQNKNNKMNRIPRKTFITKKCSKDDLVLVGSDHGQLAEYSLSKKRFVYDFGRLVDTKKKVENEIDQFHDWNRKTSINQLERTSDKKNFYVCGEYGYFKEFKTRNRK